MWDIKVQCCGLLIGYYSWMKWKGILNVMMLETWRRCGKLITWAWLSFMAFTYWDQLLHHSWYISKSVCFTNLAHLSPKAPTKPLVFPHHKPLHTTLIISFFAPLLEKKNYSSFVISSIFDYVGACNFICTQCGSI